MSRKVSTHTRLGAKIAGTGKPAYVVAGEVPIAYTKLLRYVAAVEPITPHHLMVLSDYFDCEPEDLVGINE